MGGRKGRNHQFEEIERDPEILLLFQSGIRNLAEWERATDVDGGGRQASSAAAAALGSSVFVCGGHCDR